MRSRSVHWCSCFTVLAACVIAVWCCTRLAWGQPESNPAEILRGHLGSILMGTFTPDGKSAITASSDESARIWDLQTGKEIRPYTGHTGPLYCLSLSGDGRTLATGAQDNTLRLWDVPQFRPVTWFAGNSKSLRSLALSPDGRLLVTAGADNSVRLWDIPKLSEVSDFSKLVVDQVSTVRIGHQADVTSAAFRSDGNLFATGDAEGTIILWSPFLDSAQRVFGRHEGGVTALVFHSNNATLISTGVDGLIRNWQLPPQPHRMLPAVPAAVRDAVLVINQPLAVVATEDQTVRLVDLNTGEATVKFTKGDPQVTAVGISSNNALVAVAEQAGRVRLYNYADGAERGVLAGHTGAVADVVFHPDAVTLSTAGSDGSVRMWKLPVAPIPLTGHAQNITTLAAAHGGQWIATGSDDKTVRQWGPNGQAVRAYSGHLQGIRALAVKADDTQLASGDLAGEIRLWNPADGAPQGVLQAHAGPISALDFERTTASLLSGGDDGFIKRWRLPVVPPRLSAGHSQPVRSAVITPDGKFAITGSMDQTVRVWDLSNGNPVRTLDVPGGFGGPVQATDVSADGTLAAAVSETGKLAVWNLADGALRHQQYGPAGALQDVAFLGDNSTLVTAEADQTLRLRRLPVAPKEVGNDGAPYAVAAVSPDRKRFAVGGLANGKPAVIVREAADGKVVATLAGHEGAISAVAFNKSGSRVITGAADKTVRVWKLDGVATEIHRLDGAPGTILAVALSEEGDVAFSSGSEPVVRQWNVADGTEIRQLTGHTGPVRDLAVRGTALYSAADDGTVRLWNTASGVAGPVMTQGGNLRCLALSPEGGLLVTAGTDKLAKLWNATTGAAVATLTGAANEITSASFSPDGKRVALASQDGLRVWFSDGKPVERQDIPTLAPRGLIWAAEPHSWLLCKADGKIEPRSATVQDAIPLPDPGRAVVAVSPDGKWLSAAGAGKVVRLWAVTNGTIADVSKHRTLAGPQGAVTDVVFSRDGQRLAAASDDKNVSLWNLNAVATAPVGQSLPAAQTLAHAAPIRALAFSPEKTWLAAAGDDFVISLWHLPTGQLAERLTGHTQAVQALALTGKEEDLTLVSGSQDNGVRTWKPAVTHVLPALAGAPPEPILQLVSLAENHGFAALTKTGKQVLRWKPDGTPLPPLVPPTAGLKLLTATADRMRLLSVNAAGQAILWDMADGKSSSTWDFGKPITSAVFSRDGKQIAVADGQTSLRIYSTIPFRLDEELTFTLPTVAAVWGNPEGTQLAGIGPQVPGQVLTRSLIRQWSGFEKGVTALVVSADGARLFGGALNGDILQWRTTDGLLEQTLQGHTDAVTELALLPNGQQLMSVSRDKSLKHWNLVDGTVIRTLAHPAAVTGVSLTADATRVATSAADGFVRLWDTASGLPLEMFTGHAEGPAKVRWLSDNVTLYSGSADKSMRVWKLAALRTSRAHDASVYGMVSYAGAGQLLTCAADGKVILTDFNSGLPVRVFEGLAGEPRAVCARPDNQRIAAGNATGQVVVWNAANGELLQSLEAGAAVTSLVYSPDNQKLAIATANKQLLVFGPPNLPQPPPPGKELTEHQSVLMDAVAPQIHFEADNRTLWAVHTEGHIGRWAYAAPTALRQFNHGGPVYGVVANRDGKTVVSCSTDQTVRIWDVPGNQQKFAMTGHVGAVHAVALSPDESLIVSSGADGTVRVWDVAGGRPLKQLAKLNDTMYSVAFHPNGQKVAAGGADRKVHVWNLLTGAEEQTFAGHTDYIHSVTFNSQGTRLLSYGYAGHLKVWNLADGKPLFEQRIGRIGNYADYAADDFRVLLSNGDGTARVLELPAAAR